MRGGSSIGPEGLVKSMRAYGTALALMFACGTVVTLACLAHVQRPPG
jgi:hypothetical protein